MYVLEGSAVKLLRISGSMFGICTTFSKPVKTQKSHIKSYHFIENLVKM